MQTLMGEWDERKVFIRFEKEILSCITNDENFWSDETLRATSDIGNQIMGAYEVLGILYNWETASAFSDHMRKFAENMRRAYVEEYWQYDPGKDDE